MAKQQVCFVDKQELAKQQAFCAKINEKNRQIEDTTGRKPLFYTHSFGCQQNVADGEKLAGQLRQMGFHQTDQRQLADFILFNTCAVREHAEEKVFGNIGELKRLKAANPNLVIGLCGCMTQQDEVVARIRRSYPFVDLLFGTHALHRLPELVFQVMENRVQVTETDDEFGYIVEGLPVKRQDSLKAWVSVMYGCNNFCTYCIVPYVRGRERSRKSQEILAEIQGLIGEGYREFTLLGQNVNSYGSDREEELSFPALLRQIQALEGDFRLRFMTPHPKDATCELIDTIAECDKIAKQLHLPVQSGCDQVLAAMNRGYTTGDYLNIIRYAREKMPEISFTSDIIVGFPGETHEAFLETVKLIQSVEYSALYTFIYSKRSGTRAADLPDPVPYADKSIWMRELLAIQEPIARGVSQSMVGQVCRVLVEEDLGDGLVAGKNDANMTVRFPASTELIGQFAQVKITKPVSWSFDGLIQQ